MVFFKFISGWTFCLEFGFTSYNKHFTLSLLLASSSLVLEMVTSITGLAEIFSPQPFYAISGTEMCRQGLTVYHNPGKNHQCMHILRSLLTVSYPTQPRKGKPHHQGLHSLLFPTVVQLLFCPLRTR